MKKIYSLLTVLQESFIHIPVQSEETSPLCEPTTEIGEVLGELFGYHTAHHMHLYTITGLF